MAHSHHVATLRAFIAQLNELRELAGSPTLSDLRRISRPSGKNPGLARELTESTTHDILSGKRKRVPGWPWVSSFVAACTTAAERTGLDVSTLGDTDVWHRRWRAAHLGNPTHSDPADRDAPESRRPPSVETLSPLPQDEPSPFTPPAVRPRPEDREEDREQRPALPRRTRQRSDATSEPPLSEDDQHRLEVYGRTGARLLQHSDVGNGDDCMRLAVIALLKGWPEEGRQWLRRAGDAGHADAPALFNDPQQLRAAAELAYRYGRHYQRAGPEHLSVAMFFYRLAGNHGQADAAYRLAMIHQSKGEDWAAASWFSRADNNGHPKAARKFDGASEQLTQAPWNTDGALPIGLIYAPEPAEPPTDDSPADHN
ncbi:tetratricopeptide repeat protein [Streptosporangium saharense]|uniref:tetratricopeptide repeat protein n=1 Tax=Streptosporangium saharense TaxID=1706840 RepID=UPI003445EEAE